MAATLDSRFGDELGKAILDRAGLNHNSISKDWKAESTGRGGAFVTFNAIVVLSREEWAELQQVANERAAQ